MTSQSSLTKEIKTDTSAIKDDTANIKEDTTQILNEISRLRSLIPEGQHEHVILDRYLDSMTSYAETVFDEAIVDESIGQDELSVTS